MSEDNATTTLKDRLKSTRIDQDGPERALSPALSESDGNSLARPLSRVDRYKRPSSANDNKGKDDDEDDDDLEEGEIKGIKHPLEHEWTFWYDKRPAPGRRPAGGKDEGGDQWESNLNSIGDFSTVEDFWRYYNHLVCPSKMEINSNIHLFKKGIKPMWEDEANAKGGKWVYVVSGGGDHLDKCWENVLLSVVGETLCDQENEVCGAVLSRRKRGDKIAVWSRSRDDDVSIISIGQSLKQCLGLEGDKVGLTYNTHEDSMRTGASYHSSIPRHQL